MNLEQELVCPRCTYKATWFGLNVCPDCYRSGHTVTLKVKKPDTLLVMATKIIGYVVLGTAAMIAVVFLYLPPGFMK